MERVVDVEKYLRNLKNLKKAELGVLDYIDKIAKENGLTYYLGYGSLLGAVRHQGFIPWDDDIDILMPRESYEKLSFLLRKSERYRVLSIFTDPEYTQLFMKIFDSYSVLEEKGMEKLQAYGAFVDVFPLDGLPSNSVLCKLHQWVLQKITHAMAYSSPGFVPSSRHLSLKKDIGTWIRKNYISLVYEKMLLRYPYRSAECCADIVGGGHALDKSVFGNGSLGTFEGKQYPIPADSHAYLADQYGNYMELPPENERVSNHEFSLYIKNQEPEVF